MRLQNPWPWATPAPGIYFGMPFADYLAIPALSNSGIKDLLVSGPNFWANSWLNPLRTRRDTMANKIGRAYHKRVLEGLDAFNAEYGPLYEDNPADTTVLRTAEDIKTALRKYNLPVTFGKKQEGIDRLVAFNPAVRVLDNMVAAHNAKHPGRELLHASLLREIELGAKAIEYNPHLKHWLLGGIPEVSVVWCDGATGIVHKIRFDYLKIGSVTDLKTVANEKGRDFEKAIDYAIASMKYIIQPGLYLPGAEVARQLIREGKIFGLSNVTAMPLAVLHDWLTEYAATPVKEFRWVFHQKELALCTEGRILHVESEANTQAQNRIQRGSARFIQFYEAYGEHTPWLSMNPPQYLDYASLPAYINDL